MCHDALQRAVRCTRGSTMQSRKRRFARLAAAVAATTFGLGAVAGHRPGERPGQGDVRRRHDAGHRQHQPPGRRAGHRLRDLEPAVRHADRQGRRRLRRHARAGRVLGGQRRRADRDLHAAGGPAVERRRAADRRRRRLHDQPLARRGVDQPRRHDRQPRRQGHRRAHGRDHQRRCRIPKLPVMDVYIVPKHIYEQYDAEAIYEYDGQDGVGSARSRSPRSGRASSSAWRRTPTGAARSRPWTR